MNVFDLVAKITLDKSGYENELTKASNFTSKIGGAITGAVSTVAKAGAVAIGAGATAVSALTKQAIDAYGEYEQLEGGIKKLFGDDVKKTVMNNADEAFKTAGMSANKYMETVTSFSASLIKSLDGDTKKSAELADVAIRDMADNANTFGSSIESVQVAYQGFAKGNYTMLDNLKLGYGGTATEMAKLINDSGVLGDKIIDLSDATKIGAQLSEVGFGKMVEAIHKVQENMNIYGTTSAEAMGTIQGSISMTKASWENLVTALSGKTNGSLDKYFNDLVNSAEAVVKNIIPVVEQALPAIGMLVEKIAPIITDKLPALISTLLPPLIRSAVTLVQGLIKALPQIFGALYAVLPQILTELFNSLGVSVDVGGLFELFDTVISGITKLFKNLGTTLAPIINSAVDLFNKVVSALNAILKNKDALDLIESIAIAIGTVIGAIKTWQAVQTVLNVILSANPIGLVIIAITALIAVVVMLVKHWDEVVEASQRVWEAMKQAFGHLGEWFKGIWEDIKSAFRGVGDWFKNKFTEAKEGIKSAWSNVTGFFTEKWEAIKNIFATAKTKFMDIGRNIVEGIKNGIMNSWESFKSWVMGKFKGIVDGVKGVFGIHSPSKVFQNIGEMCVAGLENGSEGLFDGTDFGISAKVSTENKSNNSLGIDYKQLGQSVAEALAGFSINMDGRTVAQLLAGDMNYQLGVLNARRV